MADKKRLPPLSHDERVAAESFVTSYRVGDDTVGGDKDVSAQELLWQAFQQVFSGYDKSDTQAKLVYDYLRSGSFFDIPTFDTSNSDPMLMSYNEGRRSLFLEIQTFLTTTADDILKNKENSNG